MRQFSTVFWFEFMSYLKNRSFIITSAVLLGIALLVGFIPMIVSGVGAIVYRMGGDVEVLPMAIYDARGTLSPDIINNHLDEETWVWFDHASYTNVESTVAEGEYSAVLVVNGLTYTLTMTGADVMSFRFSAIDNMVRQGYVATRMAEIGLTSKEEAATLIGASTNSMHVFVGRDASQSFLIGYVLLMVLYMSIIMYGSLIIQSVATEKSTKVMELLIISVKPIHMIFGKVLSAAVAGLAQLITIIVAAVVGINISMSVGAQMPDIMSLVVDDLANTGFIAVYAVIFFLFGFLTFSFLFAAFGAMASSIEDVKSLAGYPVYLFLPGFFIAIFALTNPTAGHVAPLSFVPFLSPLVMFARISMTEVPPYQILISIAVNLATIVAAGMFSAKLYRVGVLMYGMKPTLGNILKAVTKG